MSTLVWYRASFCPSGEAWFAAGNQLDVCFTSAVWSWSGPFQCYAELIWLPALLRRAQAEAIYPRTELQPSAYATASTSKLCLFATGQMIKKPKQPVFLTFKLKYLLARDCSNYREFEIGPVLRHKWIVTQVLLFCITTFRLWLILHDAASRLFCVQSQHLMYSI